MKTSISLIVSISLLFIGASVTWTKQATKTTKQHPRKPKKATSMPTPRLNKKAIYKILKRAIKKGSKQLKGKKYSDFLKRFVSPVDKKRILGNDNIKTLAPRFGRYKAAMLLAVFEWIKDKTPTLSSDRKYATYHLKGFRSSTPKKRIRFINIKGIWYVKD